MLRLKSHPIAKNMSSWKICCFNENVIFHFTTLNANCKEFIIPILTKVFLIGRAIQTDCSIVKKTNALEIFTQQTEFQALNVGLNVKIVSHYLNPPMVYQYKTL